MPFSGTADGKFHDPGAGITGFVLPAGASAATRKLYAQKLVTIPWTAQLEKDGDYRKHCENVKMEFIRDHVAPLFMGNKVPGQTHWAALPHLVGSARDATQRALRMRIAASLTRSMTACSSPFLRGAEGLRSTATLASGTEARNVPTTLPLIA